MPHPSKRKGDGYEYEVFNMAAASGLHSKRARGSNGESLGYHAEVDGIIGAGDDVLRIQCKRRKDLPMWLAMSDNVDAVALRQDSAESMILLRLSDFLDILKDREQCRDEITRLEKFGTKTAAIPSPGNSPTT